MHTVFGDDNSDGTLMNTAFSDKFVVQDLT